MPRPPDLAGRPGAGGPAPRINAAPAFGVRPGNPFLFHVAAAGERPLTFSADGLHLDAASGNITGEVGQPGEYAVNLRVKNTRGTVEKPFKLVAGETLAMTPPMGWNSRNHYAGRITQDLVLANASA